MKKYGMGILGFILILLLIFLLLHSCDKGKKEVILKRIHYPMNVIKEKIVYKEKAIDSLKKKKAKISYSIPKVPDSIITICDTIYINLVNCDSINRLDSIMIAKYDSLIIDKDLIIAGFEQQFDSLNTEIKKEKRKTLLTKIIGGAAIVLTLIIAK